MKIKYFITLIGILIFINTSAQRFNGGVLAGLNASQIDGDHWAGYYKMGLNFGAFVNTDFQEKWGGQLEIKYSAKGSSTPANYPDIMMISLKYVDMPVLATYEAVDKLKIQAGVSFNYLFSAKYYEGDWFDDWDLEPEKIETSLVFGLNYRLFSKIDLNARYGYSILPIRSKLSTSSWGEGAWFNNVVSFAVYYNIGNK